MNENSESDDLIDFMLSESAESSDDVSSLISNLEAAIAPLALNCSICGFPCLEHKHLGNVLDKSYDILSNLIKQLIEGLIIYKRQRLWTSDIPIDTVIRLSCIAKTHAVLSNALHIVFIDAMNNSGSSLLLGNSEDSDQE